MIELRHPDRHTPQFAYSQGDIAYLERTGWRREPVPEPKLPALLKSSPAIVPVAESQALASDASDAGAAPGLDDSAAIRRKPRSDKGKPRKAAL